MAVNHRWASLLVMKATLPSLPKRLTCEDVSSMVPLLVDILLTGRRYYYFTILPGGFDMKALKKVRYSVQRSP